MSIEMEANQFAMALIMPEEMVREEMERLKNTDSDVVIRVLSKKFKVSKILMSFRLSMLGYE